MIDFIKSLIPNMFFFVGYGLLSVGTKLHKLLQTEAGKQMVLMEAFQTALQAEMQRSLSRSGQQAPRTSNPGDSFFLDNGNETKH